MERKLAQGTETVRGIVRITRHPFLWGEIGVLRPVIATAAYALFLVFHGRLFGAPLV
jgi:hypothetical protein